MGCEKCEEFRDSGRTSFYRWKNANIEMRGCGVHLREIFEVLSAYQNKDSNKVKNVRHFITLKEKLDFLDRNADLAKKIYLDKGYNPDRSKDIDKFIKIARQELRFSLKTIDLDISIGLDKAVELWLKRIPLKDK